jgi:ParB family chromosome partitioning protein
LLQIDIDRISPNRNQPRSEFEEDQLEELAQSLKEAGVLQPVVVRPRKDGGFELIAGERRWRAAQRIGLLKIPAVVREVEDDRLLELALIENLQRANLNSIETAEAYQALMLEHDLNQQELADRLGKARTTIANAVRLLNLPPQVQLKIRSGALSAGHAKALASLANTQAQIELAERIVAEDLSVRQVESITAKVTRARDAGVRIPAKPDPNVQAAETELQRSLGTKVRIVSKGKGGRLEIHYYSDEELERIYSLISDATRH